MDKFGIFKLINSFFDFYKQNSSSFSQQKQSEDYSSQPDSSASFASNQYNQSNPLGFSLPSTYKKEENSFQGVHPSSQPKLEQVKTPLQSQMLSLMKTHDDILFRVKNKK